MKVRQAGAQAERRQPPGCMPTPRTADPSHPLLQLATLLDGLVLGSAGCLVLGPKLLRRLLRRRQLRLGGLMLGALRRQGGILQPSSVSDAHENHLALEVQGRARRGGGMRSLRPLRQTRCQNSSGTTAAPHTLTITATRVAVVAVARTSESVVACLSFCALASSRSCVACSSAY